MTRNYTLTCGVWLVLASGLLAADAPGVPRRLAGNPIIRPEMLPGTDGRNINGPSLIRVPDWVPKPLGRYYLYFADHQGTYIRMAYADRLEGPWKIKPGGVLRLEDCPGAKGHIASPDVLIDPEQKQFRLYFHGPARGGQRSFVALSPDGLSFKANAEILGQFYFRVFRYDGKWYALAKRGDMYCSKDGLTAFESGPSIFADAGDDGGDHNGPGPRHVAVRLRGDQLDVYYSSIGDEPERILKATATLKGDWRQWRVGAASEVLRPREKWEGADLPVKKSNAGAAKKPEHALRDPAIFTDADGKVYLLYSIAGEHGIGIAELPE